MNLIWFLRRVAPFGSLPVCLREEKSQNSAIVACRRMCRTVGIGKNLNQLQSAEMLAQKELESV